MTAALPAHRYFPEHADSSPAIIAALNALATLRNAPMPAIKTRLATRADLDAVAPLFDAYRQFYEREPNLALARQYLAERMERNESVIYVAEDASGKLIGFTQLYPTFCSVRCAHTFVLYDLFVTPAARGTGAGRRLMEAAEAHAANAGAARMELSTARTNKIGQALYESQGWAKDETFLVYGKSFKN
jgi:ribosomal protein S18 acetylase RimI-like enzyme